MYRFHTLRFQVDPASAPGTDGDLELGDSSAGTSNTGTPDTIPYQRFKEVNDRLGPYKRLEELGYSPDSLARLVDWEMAYTNDPVGSWLHIAGQLDLPPDVKAAVESALTGNASASSASTARPAESVGGNETESDLAKRLAILEERDRQNTVATQNRQAKENLDGLVKRWLEADTEEGLKTPRRAILNYISGNAGAGGGNPDAVFVAARNEFLEDREELLGDAVKTVRRNRGTQSVSGSGAGPVTPATPVKITSAAQASKAAVEMIERMNASS